MRDREYLDRSEMYVWDAEVKAESVVRNDPAYSQDCECMDIDDLSIDTQKRIDVLTWDFIRDNVKKLDNRRFIEDDWSGHDIISLYKYMFRQRLVFNTGVMMRWFNGCILCEHFIDCSVCPLKSCENEMLTNDSKHKATPYAIVCNYAYGSIDDLSAFEDAVLRIQSVVMEADIQKDVYIMEEL